MHQPSPPVSVTANEPLDDLLGTTLHHRDDVFRNIVGLRKSRDPLAFLNVSAADSAVGIKAEMATRARLPNPLVNRPFESGYGAVIAYPFQAPHWARTRFSDGSYGVWYGAASVATTVYETVWHFQSEIRGSGLSSHAEPIVRERRVSEVSLNALLFDLRPHCDREPDLLHPHDYRFCQSIGRQLQSAHHPGVVSRSARDENGDVFAIFSPDYLSNVRDHCYLRYSHAPDGTVTVERTPSETWLTIPPLAHP